MTSAAAGVKRPYSAMVGDGPTMAVNAVPYHQSTFSPHSVTGSTRDEARPLDHLETPKSRPGSAPPTPALAHPLPVTPRSFAPDVSIVLVGVRGTGKSTLAVIASVAFQRRVVDTEIAFKEATGQCGATYRKTYGAAEYQQRQLDVLRHVLTTYEKNCILVCGTASLERSGQLLMQEYSKTHPVIHITRDAKSVCEHLKTWDEHKVESLLRISGSMYRACSNYEFYNSTESLQTPHGSREQSLGEAALSGFPGTSHASPDLSSSQRSPASFLTLKRVENHFLKFISLITAPGVLPTLEPAYPLSHVPVEARSYTYAVSAPLSAILSDSLDIEELEVGADAFEIVVDSHDQNSHAASSVRLDQIGQAFSSIRRNTIMPIVYHTRRVRSVNSLDSQESTYLDLVRHGLRFAPTFATIELTADENHNAQILLAKGTTKIIGHHSEESNVTWDDNKWVELYEKGRAMGCDLIRFTRHLDQPEDVFAVQRMKTRVAALDGPHLQVIAYNTGTKGRTSACFNEVLTSVSHPSVEELLQQEQTRLVHYPAITAKEATQALHSSFIFDSMRHYIIGGSAGYSLSPAMHSAAYKALGLPHTYEIRQIPSLNNIRKLLDDPNFGGSSVSLPYKIEVIALTHSLSRHARAIGAVNTLVPVRNLQPDGSLPDEISLLRERSQSGPVKALYGENTDWLGVRSCIRRGLSPANAVGPRTSGLVIGAGGMARAAVYAMLQLGVRHIFIHNRTPANAEKLVAHFTRLLAGSGPNTPPILQTRDAPTTFTILESREDSWPENFRQPTIIVSCIPTHALNTTPAPNFTLPPHWLKSPTGGVVLEIAYKTLNTPLLRQIRAESHRGWVALDGLDLLPEQGFAQFELFTGRRAPRRLMRVEVLRAWRDAGGVGDDGTVRARLEAMNDLEP